jgi:hypothetical protein
VVDFQAKFTEPPLRAPLSKGWHERPTVEFILHPPEQRLPIAPHRRELVPATRPSPDDGVQAPVDRARLGQRPLQMSAKLLVAILRTYEFRKD